ncbi:hypothetical protein [Nonomuraea dietziae]|uniref:hypothetical protein n=1 Tax=Nonomuraea dietziae TaxID=65515 RepID=UPI0033FEBE3A
MTQTSDSPWRPLPEREQGLTGERELVEGVPDYLLPTLQKWLNKQILNYNLEPSLRLRLRRDIYVRVGATSFLPDDDDLLTLIDAALHINESSRSVSRAVWVIEVKELRFRLWEAGSIWQPNADISGLERRVDDTVRDAYQKTIAAAAPDVAQHLKKAWASAYGYQPDPTRAYSEAIKAVEAATIPVVLPNDAGATLGKVIGEMGQGTWTMVIDDKNGQPSSAEAALALMRLVWHGQRDRHAGPKSKPVTQKGAEAAVHAAVTLVQWFGQGAVVKQ